LLRHCNGTESQTLWPRRLRSGRFDNHELSPV